MTLEHSAEMHYETDSFVCINHRLCSWFGASAQLPVKLQVPWLIFGWLEVGGYSLQRLVVVQSEAEIEECSQVIASSFGTVAQDFGLTEEIAPTNPAFITTDKLREY